MSRPLLASRFAVGASIIAAVLAMASVSCRDQATGPASIVDGEAFSLEFLVPLVPDETGDSVVAVAKLDSVRLQVTDRSRDTTLSRPVEDTVFLSLAVQRGTVAFVGRIYSGAAAIYACDTTLSIPNATHLKVNCKRIQPLLAAAPRTRVLHSGNDFADAFRIWNIHPDSGGLDWNILEVSEKSGTVCGATPCPLRFDPNKLPTATDGTGATIENNVGAKSWEAQYVEYPSGASATRDTAIYEVVMGSFNRRRHPLGNVKVQVLDCPLSAHAGADIVVVDLEGDGEAVELDGRGSIGCGLSYEWSEDNVSVATTVVDRVTFERGVHEVTLTVTDRYGGMDTDIVRVTVDSIPPIACETPPIADAGRDTIVVDSAGDGSERVPLDGSGSTGTALTYDWSEDGATLTTAAVDSVPFLVGVHVVTLTVADTCRQTSSDARVITVCPKPPGAHGGRDTVVKLPPGADSVSVKLDGTASTGTNLVFAWFARNRTYAGAEPSVFFHKGEHTAVLRVTDFCGQTDSASVRITVIGDTTENEPPVADAGPDQEHLDTDGDAFETVTLNGSGSSDPDGTIVTYAWRSLTNPIAIDSVPMPTVRLPLGVHDIELEVTDNGTPALQDTDIVRITVATEALIDIKPTVNCNANNVIPVVLFTTPALNAGNVIDSTVTFGPDSAKEIHGGPHKRDVDNDGKPDLLFHFKFGDTGLDEHCGMPYDAELRGWYSPGPVPFLGTDSVPWGNATASRWRANGRRAWAAGRGSGGGGQVLPGALGRGVGQRFGDVPHVVARVVALGGVDRPTLAERVGLQLDHGMKRLALRGRDDGTHFVLRGPNDGAQRKEGYQAHERPDERGVQLLTRHPRDDQARFLRHERIPIRAGAGERLVGVDDGDDLTQQVRGLISQIRVTARIEVPVVFERHRGSQSREPLGLRQDLGPEHGVALHDPPFALVERARLLEDLHRDVALAHVVQEGRLAEHGQSGLVELQPPAEVEGQGGHVDRVREGVVLVSLDCEDLAQRRRVVDERADIGDQLTHR